MQKLSDLNYKILDKKGKEFVVHISRLKKYDQTPWSFENARPKQKIRQIDSETLGRNVEMWLMFTGYESESQVCETQTLEGKRMQLQL